MAEKKFMTSLAEAKGVKKPRDKRRDFQHIKSSISEKRKGKKIEPKRVFQSSEAPEELRAGDRISFRKKEQKTGASIFSNPETFKETPKINKETLAAKKKREFTKEIIKKAREARAAGNTEGAVDLLGKARKALFKKGLRKTATMGLKSIPLIGGVISAIQSKDVSAAVPGLDAEKAGPAPGSPSAVLEDPNATQEEREIARKKLQFDFNKFKTKK